MQQGRAAQVLGDSQLRVAERGVEHVTDPAPKVGVLVADGVAEDRH